MEEIHHYGVAKPVREGDVFEIADLIEKPSRQEAPSNLAIAARYVFAPEIFEAIKRTPPGKNGELQITDALKVQATEGMVLAYRFQGRRFDCGSVDGFVEATNYFYDRYKRGQ